MNFSPYVGITYELRGCWELVRLFYLNELQIVLPTYAEQAPDMERARLGALIEAERGAWIEVDVERPGDAVLFRVMGELSHVGIVVGDGRFLHARPGVNSCIESYRLPTWSRRVEGFYRHRGAA